MSINGKSAHQTHADEASIEQALDELRRFPRDQWLDLARSDQSIRWRKGLGILAEVYFRQLPEVRGEIEEALVLINGEVQLRREVGDSPGLMEYQRRFPELAENIALQFEVDRILGATADTEAIDTEDYSVDIQLPGYVFLDEIGRGASSVVYKARQLSLDRLVAIKVLRVGGADARQLARQRQEAEILARLHHPNVVHVYEMLEHRGCLNLVMEYVEGETLAERLQGRPATSDESARLALALAETIQVVHENGVLHRDLKPSNVLTTNVAELKVTDFGLAKLQSSANLLTTTDSVLGTPSYMAPEQAIGEAHAVGPQADVYSLGAILYELLTGRPPFLGATVLDTLSLIRYQEPVPPRRLQPKTPRDLEIICLKCLEKNQNLRYATAGDLANDLRRFRQGKPIIARLPGSAERLARLVRRKPAASAAIAISAALVGVLIAARWMILEQKRRLSIESLVASIATADSHSLSPLLEKISAEPNAFLPMIREELAASRAEENTWVNLSVAELAANPDATGEPLLAHLPNAGPFEVPAIIDALRPRSESLGPSMWRALQRDGASDESQLRLGCLAAQIAASDDRWVAIAPAVSRALVRQHPVDIGTYIAALRPARAALVPTLVALYREPATDDIARDVAAGILARFADDQPATLADLIGDADAVSFRLLLSELQGQSAVTLPRLKSMAEQEVSFENFAADPSRQSTHDLNRAYDLAQRRRANVLVAMWRLGEIDAGLRALGYDANPALRGWLIELLAPLGVSTDRLWALANSTVDDGTRQSLILAIGQSDLATMTPINRQKLIEGVLHIYQSNPDAGVHSACRWLLRNRLRAAEKMLKADIGLRGGITTARRWYVGPNGHSFTVFISPGTFSMGSPSQEVSREEDEAVHNQSIPYGFAISTEEVTIAQCRKFRERYFNTRYCPTEDCPANNITWFDAAAYCRAISEQEGISEDQMCYPPVAEIRPGMKLQDNWLERTGYRLPTEAEWEYACRGGATTNRFCGPGEELLSRYAWYLKNSDNRAWPVGRLKPNNFGLFDVLGNVAERCQDTMATYPGNTKQAATGAPALDELLVNADSMRATRGGNFDHSEDNLRSARRNANSAGDQWAIVGFRIARTVRADE